ncbi:hypothetical protein [Nonomuraea zeae]|uniref:Uncharacterized protein n=1 Tax=Nonomuraea zeae TaxID=1642303 RepID=A0A5S4GUE4_9ACTN|nr:hypothetical protein [Nonomuraea zeae]TMR36094.1 hypothetical protein ETD85_11895 [Nonomuraea zeae]
MTRVASRRLTCAGLPADIDRCRAAGVPDEVGFATRLALATAGVLAALEAGRTRLLGERVSAAEAAARWPPFCPAKVATAPADR